MKPFDLEAAKRGEAVTTRNGKKAVFSSVSPNGNGLAFWIENTTNVFELKHYYNDGSRLGIYENVFDLFMVSKTAKYWRRHYKIYDRGLMIIKTEIVIDLYYQYAVLTGKADFGKVHWVSDWESFEVETD